VVAARDAHSVVVAAAVDPENATAGDEIVAVVVAAEKVALVLEHAVVVGATVDRLPPADVFAVPDVAVRLDVGELLPLAAPAIAVVVAATAAVVDVRVLPDGAVVPLPAFPLHGVDALLPLVVCVPFPNAVALPPPVCDVRLPGFAVPVPPRELVPWRTLPPISFYGPVLPALWRAPLLRRPVPIQSNRDEAVLANWVEQMQPELLQQQRYWTSVAEAVVLDSEVVVVQETCSPAGHQSVAPRVPTRLAPYQPS